MPRRNRRKRTKPPRELTPDADTRPPNYYEISKDLVERGLASTAILGHQSPPAPRAGRGVRERRNQGDTDR